jgi:hypothetical protein
MPNTRIESRTRERPSSAFEMSTLRESGTTATAMIRIGDASSESENTVSARKSLDE